MREFLRGLLDIGYLRPDALERSIVVFEMQKTLLRLVGWLLAGMLTLALLAVTIFWLINRKDEALLPEVAQAIVFTLPLSEAMQRNAYFILLGLEAPIGEDALAAEMRFFAAQKIGRAHV